MIHPLLNIGIQAARQASKVLLRYIDRLDTLVVTAKAKSDWVTEVDKQSEQEIIEVIRRAYPDHAILGEESGYSAGNEFTWVIDPLDGTTNYIHGFPHFSISIAVKQRDQLEAGVVYDPLRNELFTAARGQGSFLNDRRMRVSKVPKLENALIGTGFAVREVQSFPFFINIFSHIFPKSAGIRRAGSAALDLAYVAAGRLDGYWESPLKEWDMAAGVLLVQEAGGRNHFHDQIQEPLLIL
jgi:myo-inositol-1(or 4)-monophosphatase